MARVQVNDPLIGRAPTTQAPGGPGDIFIPVQEAPPIQDNSLGDVADALSSFNTALQRDVAKPAVERMSKEDFAKGLRAWEENRTKHKNAIDAGKLPAGASAHFRRGWRAAQLRNSGRQFSTQLMLAVNTGEFGNSDDPEEFEANLAQFKAAFAAENLQDVDDLEFAEFFDPQAQQGIQSARARHVEKLIKEAQDGYQFELEQEMQGVLEIAASTWSCFGLVES